MSFFKAVRLMVLLMVLLFVALGSWHSRITSTNWDEPLWVVIYPINGDGRDDLAVVCLRVRGGGQSFSVHQGQLLAERGAGCLQSREPLPAAMVCQTSGRHSFLDCIILEATL